MDLASSVDLAAGVDRFVDTSRRRPKVLDRFGDVHQCWKPLVEPLDDLASAKRGAQCLNHRDEIANLKGATFCRCRDVLADVGTTRGRDLDSELLEFGHFGSFGLKRCDPVEVGKRSNLPRQFAAYAERAVFFKQPKHLVEFEYRECVVVHTISVLARGSVANPGNVQ